MQLDLHSPASIMNEVTDWQSIPIACLSQKQRGGNKFVALHSIKSTGKLSFSNEHANQAPQTKACETSKCRKVHFSGIGIFRDIVHHLHFWLQLLPLIQQDRFSIVSRWLAATCSVVQGSVIAEHGAQHVSKVQCSRGSAGALSAKLTSCTDRTALTASEGLPPGSDKLKKLN